ncbi:MAG: cytochrome c [Acidobacteria bacterium]|nr:cytochrome c [Acidobacteriota bacterium]
MGSCGTARLLCLAFVLAVPLTLVAQEEGGGGGGSALGVTIGKLQTEEQKRGDAIFHKNCHLCHISTAQKRELKIVSTELVGLFMKPNVSEQAVRQLVQGGIPRRMPSFQYTLNASELNDLIAYLRIR